MAGGRTGQVFLEDFDVGIATTIGGELINVSLDGEEVQVYAVQVPGVNGPGEFRGLVPIVMSEPEDVYRAILLPEIMITRTSVIPQMNRWMPGGHEYQIPASNSRQVPGPGGQLMPNLVEKKWWTYPFEISYDVHVRARLRRDASRMFHYVGRFLWAYGQIFLKDSVGDERGYYAFVDTNDGLDELADVSNRLQGFLFSMRVEAELDFAEPFMMPSTPQYTNTVRTKG